MAEHPIDGLMEAALRNIKSMVDVNTITVIQSQRRTGRSSFQFQQCPSALARGGVSFPTKALCRHRNPCSAVGAAGALK